jgi:hypothetical protein
MISMICDKHDRALGCHQREATEDVPPSLGKQDISGLINGFDRFQRGMLGWLYSARALT